MWNVCIWLLLPVLSRAGDISFDNSRNKRQDYWSWGLVEDNYQNTQTTPADEEEAVCQPYNPAMPNYYKPGRRVSETKCYEYAWQMKLQEDRNQREKECIAYRRRKAGLHSFRNLVVGGRQALAGEYPHMGAIGWRATEGTWIFKCGGALISPRFVLTAGHCTKSSRDPSVAEAAPKVVRLGARNIVDVPEPHDELIARIIVHPSYSPPRKYNDIALLQLSKDVEFSRHIQPACLWTLHDTSNVTSATVTGWGVMESGGRETSANLQTAEVNIIDASTCSSLLHYCNRNWCGLDQTQVCAGKLEGGVDTCQGDSGGPLQVRAEGSLPWLVGVTSFGFGCARAASPGVYTRVAAYADWLERHVWG